MASNSFGMFNPEDAKLIHSRVIGNQRDLRFGQPAAVPGALTTMYYCVLKEPMDAATDPLTGYTSAKAYLLKYDLSTDADGVMSGSTALDMVEADQNEDDTITITNRGQASADAGTLVFVIELNNCEYAPLWVDCEPYGSESVSEVL